MPWSENTDFQNAVIYTIKNKNEPTQLYVGSTVNFKHRCRNHKYYSKKAPTCQLYQAVIDSGSWDNWSFEIYELFPCNNLGELLKREDECRILLNANLNTYTQISYVDRNQRRHTVINCECGGKSQRLHISTHYKSKRHQDYLATIVV
jgi:hypothetical protein